MAKNFPKLTIDNKTKMQKLREHMRQGYRPPQTNARKAYIQTAEKNEDEEKILKVVRGKKDYSRLLI